MTFNTYQICVGGYNVKFDGDSEGTFRISTPYAGCYFTPVNDGGLGFEAGFVSELKSRGFSGHGVRRLNNYLSDKSKWKRVVNMNPKTGKLTYLY
jgi:hypothetical protein